MQDIIGKGPTLFCSYSIKRARENRNDELAVSKPRTLSQENLGNRVNRKTTAVAQVSNHCDN